ncbi:hypothetical protein [Carnobacterium maltaromaticum]|uniref:hypothetical protein n=1 Tax=Carnobacterium maltaromaticum TaxID=2751 RepID=UPI00295F5798|nr:hypothetical protein [Carnobacterium maltaromaticum]
MLLLLKICGILGFIFCLVLVGFALKIKKVGSKKFQKKIGLIFFVSLALFSFSQFKLSKQAAVQRETYTISSKSTLEGSQTFLRVLVFSKNKKDLETIFNTLEKKDVDSLFVRFNVDNGGEIGKFIANGKIAWTKEGEKQVGLKKDKVGFDYNKELK